MSFLEVQTTQTNVCDPILFGELLVPREESKLVHNKTKKASERER